MTAHPIELIAGMDDDIDLDQKDQVARHIASCNTCRTVARTMQRVDGLIALPEPVLPLPDRTTPREGARVSGWAAIVAGVLTLAVALAALTGSFKQTQVATAAVDACGVLASAVRSAGVGAASDKASAISLSSPLSGSWTACRYGDIATRSGPLVLFRSEPTAGWEVRGLLAGLTSADLGNGLVFGKFIACFGDASSERWITEAGSCAASSSQAMAVVAEPYFFVVTAPSSGKTMPLADAIVAELKRRPWPPLSEAAKIDACDVIMRVAPSAGVRAEGRFPQRRHWAEIPSDSLAGRGMSENVCSFHGDDGHDQHVWIRAEPTTLQQATTLLPLVSGSLTPSTVGDWVQVEAGMWLAHGRWPVFVGTCPACPVQAIDFTAIAVLDEPHFFALTGATDEAAIQIARAVKTDLKRP